MSVLQKVADVLSVPVAELRGEDDESPGADERPEAFDMIRSALTGHPAIGAVLGAPQRATPASTLNTLSEQHAAVRELVRELLRDTSMISRITSYPSHLRQNGGLELLVGA